MMAWIDWKANAEIRLVLERTSFSLHYSIRHSDMRDGSIMH